MRLKAPGESAMRDGGTVLIPAFSIGPTQELLCELESITHDVTKTSHFSKTPNSVGAGLPPKGSIFFEPKSKNLRAQSRSNTELPWIELDGERLRYVPVWTRLVDTALTQTSRIY